ncbi:MAG: CvpA family protein [Candidatus Poribacteria bacterium]
MSFAIISSLIILDIIVIGILALFAFHGYRRGAIKSLLSFFLILIVVLISMLLFERPALFLQVMFDVSSPITRVICFSIIFIVFYVISRVVYFVLSRLASALAVRGIFSGVIGSLFSIAEAIILVSVVFMNINFFPIRQPMTDALSFNIMKDIPKDLKESCLWFLPKDDLGKYEEYLKSKKENSKQEEIK